MADHDDLPELSDVQRTRWQAAVSDISEMSAGLRDGTATDEAIQGTLNRLLSCDIDHATLLNAPHIPRDAQAYALGLEKILRRIPDGWGRWIGHGAGWYSLVVGLDERLAAIDPGYVVYQVKEKFGTLRYSCDPSGEPNQEVWSAFDVVITDAELASAVICELCGRPGLLRQSSHFVKTLCGSCAEMLGYAAIPPHDGA